MANIFDTAKYICEKLDSVSAMKLQRLCYYAQAWHLAWHHSPLFGEDFRAWPTGPVCEELYSATEGKRKYTVSPKDLSGGEGYLSEVQKETIDIILSYYGNRSAQWLSQLSMMEDPWSHAEKIVPPGPASIIDKETMMSYYSSLKE